jgi:hypothetical protein
MELSEILPSETTMVRNILKTYRNATSAQIAEGRTWYADAHELAKTLDPESPARAAGVISALSPMTHWERNQYLATVFYREGLTGGSLRINIRKAHAIRNGADIPATLNAPKTIAFAATIADPHSTSHVVIDRHAVSIALGRCSTDADTAILGRKGAYEWYESAYRKAAKRAGASPSEVQAVTWVVWRQTAIRTAAAMCRKAESRKVAA